MTFLFLCLKIDSTSEIIIFLPSTDGFHVFTYICFARKMCENIWVSIGLRHKILQFKSRIINIINLFSIIMKELNVSELIRLEPTLGHILIRVQSFSRVDICGTLIILIILIILKICLNNYLVNQICSICTDQYVWTKYD